MSTDIILNFLFIFNFLCLIPRVNSGHLHSYPFYVPSGLFFNFILCNVL